jgi:hypothetical protein
LLNEDDKKRDGELLEKQETLLKLNKFFLVEKNNSIPKNETNTKMNLQQFISLVFGESSKIGKSEFILKCFENKSASFLLAQIEKIIETFMDDLDKKLKTPLYRNALDKIIELEDNKIPSAIAILCNKITNIVDDQDNQIDRMIYSLGDEEKVLCESIINFFLVGRSEESLELDGIPLSVLVFALKSILESLKTPLFTVLISELILNKNEENCDLEALYYNALSLLPTCNRDVISYVGFTLNKLISNKKFKFEINLSSFFSRCFFHYEIHLTNKAPKFLHYLFTNIPYFECFSANNF